jgi:hypothetical protein
VPPLNRFSSINRARVHRELSAQQRRARRSLIKIADSGNEAQQIFVQTVGLSLQWLCGAPKCLGEA